MKNTIDLLVLARMKKAGYSIVESARATSVKIEELNAWCRLHFDLSAFEMIKQLNEGVMPEYERPAVLGFYKELSGERKGLLISHKSEENTFFLDPETSKVRLVKGRCVDLNKPIKYNRKLYEEAGLAEIDTIYYTLKAYCDGRVVSRPRSVF